jgi:hypothetical protein
MSEEKNYSHEHHGRDRFKGTKISSINPERAKAANNKSGYRGVFWEEKSKRWRAGIGFQGKKYFIGRFKTVEEAINARKEFEERFFDPILKERPVSKKSVEHLPYSNLVNLIGTKKDHYTVIEFAGRYGNTAKWVCKCECGNTFISTSSEIKKDKVISCGCIVSNRKKYSYHACKNTNIYYVDGTQIPKMFSNTCYRNNNTSGVKGVFFQKRDGSWYAKLTFKGIEHRVRCDTKAEAIKARSALEREYYIPFIKKHKNVIEKVKRINKCMVR